MSITESGLYFADFASGLSGGDLDLTDDTEIMVALLDNAETPNFLTDSGFSDTNEVTGGANWPAGGILLSEAGAGITSVNPTFGVVGTKLVWGMDPIEVDGVTASGMRGLVFYRIGTFNGVVSPYIWLTDLQSDRAVNGQLRFSFTEEDGVFWMAREDDLG